MLAEEFAAALREPSLPLPTASALLSCDSLSRSPSYTNLAEHALAAIPLLPQQQLECPQSAPSTLAPRDKSPDFSHSRLARRWLAGIKARDASDGDEDERNHCTPSMLNLTMLCTLAGEDERSPTSVVTEADKCPDEIMPSSPTTPVR